MDIDSFLYLITYSCGTAENKQLRNFNILAIPVTLLLIISFSPKSILTRGPEGSMKKSLFTQDLIKIFMFITKSFSKILPLVTAEQTKLGPISTKQKFSLLSKIVNNKNCGPIL